MDLVLTSGTWPREVTGEALFSSPEPVPGVPYALFGPGRLCRLSLQPGTHGAPEGRFAWRSHRVDSPSARLFGAAPESFSAGPTGFTSPFGVPNQANTAPLPWGDRLFATWDVGRPAEVDAAALGFLGEVGHRDSWGDPALPMGGVLPFLLSSAHPVVDPERDCMWSVKLVIDMASGTQGVEVVHWDGTGTTVSRWPVRDAKVRGGAHCVTQSRDFLVLADSGNFIPDLGEMAGGERTAVIDTSTPVWVIRKDQLLSTPPGDTVEAVASTAAPSTGHMYARWDDSEGIQVLFEHMDLVDLGYRIEAGDLDSRGEPVDPALVGFYNMAMAPNTVSEMLIDPGTGRAETLGRLSEDWTHNLQLSAMDWSTEGLSAPTLHHVAVQGFRAGAVTRRAMQAYSDRLGGLPPEDTPGVLASLRRGDLGVASSYTYPNTGEQITSPVFVPRDPAAHHDPAGRPGDGHGGDTTRRSAYGGTDPGGHDGFVVVPVLSDEGMRVDLFDASCVGSGPVATLCTPAGECVPALLHSAWMPRAPRADSSLERLRFADEIDGHVEALPDELARIVHAVADQLADPSGG